MTKELEALKIGIPKLKKLYENSAKKMNKNDILGFDLTFVYLDKVLAELKSIKEANPSEAMKELNRIDCNITYLLNDCDIDEEVSMNFKSIRDNKSCEVIKQALLKAQEQDKEIDKLENQCLDVLADYIRLKNKAQEQEKVIKIIKEKCIGNDNIYLVYVSKNYELYKSAADLGIRNITQVSLNEDELLTEAEFETLKEGLK